MKTVYSREGDFLVYGVWQVNILTRTSRNQKGKAAQGMTCQRQEKWDMREAVPDGDFPSCIF